MTPPASLPQNQPGRSVWLAAALLAVAVLCLHGWLLFHAGAFCGDEVQVINLAGTHSLPMMTHDSFPVLMPLLVSGWAALGLADNDLQLRLLGLLIGLGMAVALWLPAWVARRTPPLLALIFFGLNGMAIFWTGYLRAYGLGSLLILLTLAAMVFLLGKPTWRRTALLAAAAALSVQALYHNAVLVAAISLGGWLVCWRRQDRDAALKIAAAAMLAAATMLPYWGCVRRWQQTSDVMRPGFSFQAALDNFNVMLAFPLPQHAWIWAGLGLLVAVLGLIAFFRPPPAARREGCLTLAESQLFAGIILLSSLAGYLLFLRLAALITSPWYFLPLMALAAGCCDLGISLTTFSRPARTVAWGILIGTAGLSIPFAVRDLNCRFSNMNLVAERLLREISPQDYIMVTPWHLGISFDRYYRGRAAWDTLPPVTDHSTYRFDLIPAASGLAHANQPVLERAANTLQSGHRVWVVGWMKVPPPGRNAATAEGRFLAEHSRSFETVILNIQGQTSDYEDVSLLLANGWKTNSP